jgi:NADH-quinone oxidoreductase subunit G
VLVSPSATLEEMYLLGRITRHLGSHNIDHRLRRRDFRDQEADPVAPLLGCRIAEIETRQGLLFVGSNLRAEVPIIAHRVRKAAFKGAEIGFVNPLRYEYHFPCAAYVEAPLSRLVRSLAGVLVAAAQAAGQPLPEGLVEALADVRPEETERTAAKVLLGKERALLVLGQIAQRHPRFADIRALASALARLTGAELGYLSEGANANGAALAGIVPHRGAGGVALQPPGLDAMAMMISPRRAYMLFGLEPDQDLADPTVSEQALKAADAVVCFTPFVTERLLECTSILLPIATFAEIDGTFVNAEGEWQQFGAAAELPGDVRSGWRVLRVLGNELSLPNCDYRSAEEIAAALRNELDAASPVRVEPASIEVSVEPEPVSADLDVPIYSVDAVVRRSEPLQQTKLAAAKKQPPPARRAVRRA